MKRGWIGVAMVVALTFSLFLSVGAASAAGPGGHHGYGAQQGLMQQDRMQDQEHQELDSGDLPLFQRDRMRQLLTAELPEGVTVTAVSRDVTVTGDIKTVTRTFTITYPDGQTGEIQKVHILQQQPDGTWTLVSAPDCPNR